jgi:hypothetical protein
VINSVSDAILGEPADAAQFQIVNGQLVQNAGGKNLYATVEPFVPGNGQSKLKVTWSATQAAVGDFSWSGDTVMWSDASVTRPQANVS